MILLNVVLTALYVQFQINHYSQTVFVILLASVGMSG